MDEWELIEQNAKAAKSTLDDLDSGIDDMAEVYRKTSIQAELAGLATYLPKRTKKRLKRAKE